jgi:hypothetical protein
VSQVLKDITNLKQKGLSLENPVKFYLLPGKDKMIFFKPDISPIDRARFNEGNHLFKS